VFVTNFKGDRITIIDSDTLEPDGEITGFDGIRAVSISANGKTLYAANSNSNSIAVVDLGKRQITDNVPVGRDPYGAALSPDGNLVYSGDKADNTLTVVDTSTRKVVGKVVGFDEPRQAISFTRDGRQAYVLNKDLSIAIVDVGALQIANTIGVLR
jgi:YVTN family beta-propeller protein